MSTLEKVETNPVQSFVNFYDQSTLANNMKVGKPKSKRVPVRLRHKIEKASAAKQRKQRKEAKKNPQWRSRLKKDPGIPNLFPYKDKVLAEIEESKRKKDEEQLRRRENAKALRQGRAVEDASKVAEEDGEDEDEDEELADPEDDEDVEDDEDMEEDTNPMAALLASAQARAQAHRQNEASEDEDEEEEIEGVAGLSASKARLAAPSQKALPKQALDDPIKCVTALVDRLQKTQQGIQQLLEHYQLPPLVTAGSDTTTRFLVDVARKRGRLGRGGVPNMHAAALTVLSDLNEERLELPALSTLPPQTSNVTAKKGEVQIVTQMAEPFRIEGLFGDTGTPSGAQMDVET